MMSALAVNMAGIGWSLTPTVRMETGTLIWRLAPDRPRWPLFLSARAAERWMSKLTRDLDGGDIFTAVSGLRSAFHAY